MELYLTIPCSVVPTLWSHMQQYTRISTHQYQVQGIKQNMKATISKIHGGLLRWSASTLRLCSAVDIGSSGRDATNVLTLRSAVYLTL